VREEVAQVEARERVAQVGEPGREPVAVPKRVAELPRVVPAKPEQVKRPPVRPQQVGRVSVRRVRPALARLQQDRA
jgi:hypothetical protein